MKERDHDAQMSPNSEPKAQVGPEVAEPLGPEERLLRTIGATGVGIWEWDVAANDIKWSDEVLAIFGVDRDGFDGTYEQYLSFVHEDDREELVAAVQSAISQGRPYELLHRINNATDARQRWVRCFGMPFMSPAGEMLFLTGTIEDVTSQEESAASERALQERLVHSQKLEALGQLAGGVAHDFNNLLTAIFGNIAVLRRRAEREGSFSDDLVNVCLEQIHKAADRASNLTRQLLTFGRRRMDNPEAVDLNLVVRSVESMLQRLIGSHIRLDLDAADEPFWVRIDIAQLEQIVLNLAINGRDAIGDGGLLEVATYLADIPAGDETLEPGAKPGRYAVLRVLDTGSGMPPDVLARIFEPFYTTKRPGEGTGLGLATVYGTVRGAGGHCYVRSEVGRGTVFEVRLPLSEPPVVVDLETLPELRGGTEVVLVAEDEPQVRMVTCAALRDAGYRVLEANDGLEALRTLDEVGDGVELLVTDVVMPHLDGRGLAQRARERRPGLPIVFVSGFTPEGLDALEDAFGPVVPKPFEPETLLRTVRDVLDRAADETRAPH